MIKSGQIVVGTSPVVIGEMHTSNTKITIYNMSNYDDIYLGNGDVTVSTGLELHPHVPYTIELQPMDLLHGVAVSGTQDHLVSWLQVS